MAIYTLEQYRTVQKRRALKLKKNVKRSSITAAKFTATRARMYAPSDRGTLRKGIIRRKNVVTARATGNQGFPYVHWVNQTPGTNMTTLQVKPKSQGKTTVFMDNRRIVNVLGGRMTYGLEPSNWQWSGRAMFFQLATAEGRQLNRKLSVKANRKSIKLEA